MAFKPRSKKPTPTPADIEAFISGAKADIAEGIAPAQEQPAEKPVEAKKEGKGRGLKVASKKLPRQKKSEPAPDPRPLKSKSDPIEASLGDLHQYVHRSHWPLAELIEPSLAEGRADLDKPIMLRAPEQLWLSVERHCTAIGVSKSKWIRHAITKLMSEEQMFFASQKKGEKKSS